MPEGYGYPPTVTGQPALRTPEEGVPFMERLKRLLPQLLGGRGGDERLPMEAMTERDPRLPEPGGFQAIRSGLEQVQDLGRPSPEEDALKSIERMAGGLRKK